MSEQIEGDSEARDLDTIIHSINKEIEEVTLCLTDDLDCDDEGSTKLIEDEDISNTENEDRQYYLDEGGNLYLTLSSEKPEKTGSSRKTIKPVLESQENHKAKNSRSGKISVNSGEENYTIYINSSKVKSEVEQNVDDPAPIEMNEEIYEFDELEEQSGTPVEGEQMSLLKVRPSNNTDSSGALLHSCPHCNYLTNKRYMLSRHMKSHSDDRPYICSVCDRGFKTNHSLQNHVNVHLGRKPHGCLSCESRFTTAGDLARHVRYKHTHEKRHKCTECDYATVEMSKLRRHMRAHTGERPYQCPHCTYASPDSFKLKRHLRIHTGEKPYECDICQSRFTQSNSLKSHKLIHSVDDKPVFQCALCPTTCSRKSDLRIHVQKLHYSEKPIPCRRCGKELPDRYSYKIHAKTHEGERCYSCDQCNYKSISIRNLDIHKQIHSDEKPFGCDKCGQSFRQKQLLGRHTNLYHNDNYVPPPKLERTHKCPYCTRTFAHKGNMVRHMQLHDAAVGNGKDLKIEDEKTDSDTLFDFEDPYMIDDESVSAEHFEEYEVIEEADETEENLTIEQVEPTSSKTRSVRNSLKVQPEMTKTIRKENKYGIKMENVYESIVEDDETDLPEYMVVKVLQSDDELEEEGDGCVILTNFDNVRAIDNSQLKEDVDNCFGFKMEDGNDADERTVLLDIVEDN
ncbi:transcriptional repressor CTCF [Anastrepha ludens]|uniref:transcriptional repressor CTCF n=1 Tax=Anastrepha ludens TaxID=28586 RepID=UPI0023B128B9|nr:transcriptional repressor CTCF [Anastrepha ludens]XP_053954621.1 transcriptional repressor CTCF [Anastrepha ludens]